MSKPAVAVRATAMGTGATFSLVLFLSGIQLAFPYRQVVSFLPTLAPALLIVWDLWLWRMGPFAKLHKRPHLRGLWTATLMPTQESHIPVGGNRGPIPAYVIVQQSFWSLSIRQYTLESYSDSKAFFWQALPGADTERLDFIYANNPAQAYRYRSYPHLGNCSLLPAKRNPTTMSGAYFTDRYTQGDMQLKLIDRTGGYAHFDDAQAHVQRLGAR